MEISLEIGLYEHNQKDKGYLKMIFTSVEEAVANINFLRTANHHFGDATGLAVRIQNSSESLHIENNSEDSIGELQKQLYRLYHQNSNNDEKKIQQPHALSNSNFLFEEDETTKYAVTTSGEKLPFKLFNPTEFVTGSNLLWETDHQFQSSDFAIVERRFAENKSLRLFGPEKIENLNDVAFLFRSLQDEAVEHAFLVYDFEDKGYFVQHISTGTFDAAFVDNRLLIGNILEALPKSVTLVHNHPSGTLRVSKADFECIAKLQKALDDSGIKVNNGVIINLRSGKYVVFDEMSLEKKEVKTNRRNQKEIQAYSFSKQILIDNYQPFQITSSEDTAKFITSQKFGVADKTEMLVLNNQLGIVGKFLMPPINQIDFIIGKVSKFGGTKCILYGNNLSPHLINSYNKKLHHSGIEILDALVFRSENGKKMYDSFADQMVLKTPSQMNNDLKDPSFKYIINNKNSKIMETKKDFDQVQYLKDQMKYLGFGESDMLHRELEKGLKSKESQFEINTSSDKTLPGNDVSFQLKFNKSEAGGVFLNSFQASLSNDKGELHSQNFPVSKDYSLTAKEAVNLLEGRSVKIEFHNPKSNQVEAAFVKLNFDEPKTEKGNYIFQNFYKNYGVDTAEIVEKSKLVFDKPEYRENTIKSLEKGNVVKVKFELNDQIVEGKAVLNPQYKNLSLYDMEMTRINTNKPLEGLGNDMNQDKNNVKEQSIKR